MSGVEDNEGDIEKVQGIEEGQESPLPESSEEPKERPDAWRLSQQISSETFVPNVSRYKDHFSLPVPSSTIRFRDSNGAARVILGSNSQFVLEETHSNEEGAAQITLKKMRDTSGGLQALRAIYTVETAFFLGFMLVLSLQVILFIFLDAAIYLGRTDMQTAEYGIAIGLICSLPVFIRALASALTIAGHLVVDTWNGNFLVKSFVFRSLNIATIEWILFLFHLGWPFLIMCICLLIGTDYWWEYTALTWFLCIFIFYLIFTINVIFYEMNACWETMKNQYKNDADHRVETYIQAAKQSIVLRQNHTYSGVNETTYMSLGDFFDSEDIDRGTNRSRENAITEPEEHKGIVARLTQWGCFGLYRVLDQPVALYSIKDGLDQRPFITSTSWSLEKAFCRPKNSRYVAILRGPGRVRSSQIKSTLVCSFVGLFLILLLFVAALVYIEANGALIAFFVAAFLLASWSRIRVPIALFQLAKEINLFKENANASRIRVVEDNPRHRSEGVYFVKDRHRVTEPSEIMIWILFALEISIFWLYPTGVLYTIGNGPMAVFFMFSGFIYLGRYYCSAACVLEEFGSLDCIGGKSEYETWKRKSRLNDIVGNVTKASGVRWWSGILGALALMTAGIAFTAVGESTEADTLLPLTYVPDFYYDAPQTLQYPTCILRDLGGRSMADYVFLSNLAYQSIEATQNELDKWFGPDVAFDRNDIVDEFRRNTDNYTSAVVYKYFEIPKLDNLTIVSIRGTQNSWDMLADINLWSAAALMQFIRALLPLGAVFTPIMDELVFLIQKLESETIEKVSFYKPTSNFVNYLKNSTSANRATLQVTGHSLGGGLSIITGAKTGVPAVSLSGPNAMISRRTFGITHEALDTKTFNIIPERDIVPMLDDVAQLHQYIRCEAAGNDVIGCHSSLRSLCEVLYTCGTGSGINKRPVPCECVSLFNYPIPLQSSTNNTNMDFKEECDKQKQQLQQQQATED